MLVEKSPPNLIRMRFLQALFPDASFVVILRHPVAVSYATQKWRQGSSLKELLRHWVVAHETYREDAPSVERLLEVRFEDLLRDPDELLGRVYGFLGLEPQPTRSRSGLTGTRRTSAAGARRRARSAAGSATRSCAASSRTTWAPSATAWPTWSSAPGQPSCRALDGTHARSAREGVARTTE